MLIILNWILESRVSQINDDKLDSFVFVSFSFYNNIIIFFDSMGRLFSPLVRNHFEFTSTFLKVLSCHWIFYMKITLHTISKHIFMLHLNCDLRDLLLAKEEKISRLQTGEALGWRPLSSRTPFTEQNHSQKVRCLQPNWPGPSRGRGTSLPTGQWLWYLQRTLNTPRRCPKKPKKLSQTMTSPNGRQTPGPPPSQPHHLWAVSKIQGRWQVMALHCSLSSMYILRPILITPILTKQI